MNIEREKQVQDEKIQKLYDGNGNSNSSVLDQEEALRKQLVDTMIQSATPATTPVVRVLTNVQGKRKTDINTFWMLIFFFKFLPLQEVWGSWDETWRTHTDFPRPAITKFSSWKLQTQELNQSLRNFLPKSTRQHSRPSWLSAIFPSSFLYKQKNSFYNSWIESTLTGTSGKLSSTTFFILSSQTINEALPGAW